MYKMNYRTDIVNFLGGALISKILLSGGALISKILLSGGALISKILLSGGALISKILLSGGALIREWGPSPSFTVFQDHLRYFKESYHNLNCKRNVFYSII